jgi:hypothetical protein
MTAEEGLPAASFDGAGEALEDAPHVSRSRTAATVRALFAS